MTLSALVAFSAKLPSSVVRVVITIALAVLHVSGALLFAPAMVLASIGLSGMIQNHRTGIELALFGSAAILVARSLVAALAITLRCHVARINLKHRLARLCHLSSAEARILAGYVRREAQIGYFECRDATIMALEEKGILSRWSNGGNAAAGFPFKIQPWALEYLTDHPELLPPQLD